MSIICVLTPSGVRAASFQRVSTDSSWVQCTVVAAAGGEWAATEPCRAASRVGLFRHWQLRYAQQESTMHVRTPLHSSKETYGGFIQWNPLYSMALHTCQRH
jgi:hypothetical protein